LTPHKAKKRTVKAAMSNSFGFGGTNAAVVITAVD
jgi:3-oxoacyl-[acyl-carrier-protein] synthase II